MIMKNLQQFTLLLFLIGSLVLTSCGEDFNIGGTPDVPDTGVTMNPPTLALADDDIYTQSGEVIQPGDPIEVRLTAMTGTTPLQSLVIIESGTAIDLNRIKINGTGASANPLLLFNSDKEGIDWTIEVDTEGLIGTYTYTYTVTDEDGKTAAQSITVSIEGVPPSITNMGSTEISVTPGSLVALKVEATPGSSPLKYIAVAEGPDLIADLDRLYLGSLDVPFTANPMPLSADQEAGFGTDLFIRASVEPGSKEYRIFIIDEQEEGSFIDVIITTGTSIGLIQGVLFNAAGPAGTGGLDLDEGKGTGSSEQTAEIRDEGIDMSRPSSENWNRQISVVNGSEAKFLRAGATGISENYSFENIQYVEEIQALFDAGMNFIDTNEDGDLVSSIIVEGDSFAVKNGEKYYLIIIRQIVETLEDNGDHYIIDIKR